MRRLFILLSALALLPLNAADSHQEVAAAMVQLLSDTEAALESCTDTDSTRAALPRLQQLSETAAALVQRQSALPEPTVQDYMVSQSSAAEFLKLKQSIREQITRLQQSGLMTAELRDILKIAPPEK